MAAAAAGDFVVLEVFEDPSSPRSGSRQLFRDEPGALLDEKPSPSVVVSPTRRSSSFDSGELQQQQQQPPLEVLAARSELAASESRLAWLQQSLEEARAELCECETSRTFLESALVESQTRLDVALGRLEAAEKLGKAGSRKGSEVVDVLEEDGDIEVVEEEEEEEELASAVSDRARALLRVPSERSTRVDGTLASYSAHEEIEDLRAQVERSQAYEAELRQENAEAKQRLASAAAKLARYTTVATTRQQKLTSLESELAEQKSKIAELEGKLSETAPREASSEEEEAAAAKAADDDVEALRGELAASRAKEREARLREAELAKEVESYRAAAAAAAASPAAAAAPRVPPIRATQGKEDPRSRRRRRRRRLHPARLFCNYTTKIATAIIRSPRGAKAAAAAAETPGENKNTLDEAISSGTRAPPQRPRRGLKGKDQASQRPAAASPAWP